MNLVWIRNVKKYSSELIKDFLLIKFHDKALNDYSNKSAFVKNCGIFTYMLILQSNSTNSMNTKD